MNRHDLLLSLGLILLIFFPNSSYSGDKTTNETACKPLASEMRFNALGYELGTCKSEIEALIKKKNAGPSNDNLISSQVMQDLLNSKTPESVTWIVSTYINASPPYLDYMRESPAVYLAFYNNVLFNINSTFQYATNSEQFVKIYESYEDFLNNKYGLQENIERYVQETHKSGLKQWKNKGITISLYFDQPTSSSIYYIHVDYEIDDIMAEANKDYSEMIQKKEEIEKQMEGF